MVGRRWRRADVCVVEAQPRASTAKNASPHRAPSDSVEEESAWRTTVVFAQHPNEEFGKPGTRARCAPSPDACSPRLASTFAPGQRLPLRGTFTRTVTRHAAGPSPPTHYQGEAIILGRPTSRVLVRARERTCDRRLAQHPARQRATLRIPERSAHRPVARPARPVAGATVLRLRRGTTPVPLAHVLRDGARVASAARVVTCSSRVARVERAVHKRAPMNRVALLTSSSLAAIALVAACASSALDPQSARANGRGTKRAFDATQDDTLDRVARRAEMERARRARRSRRGQVVRERPGGLRPGRRVDRADGAAREVARHRRRHRRPRAPWSERAELPRRRRQGAPRDEVRRVPRQATLIARTPAFASSPVRLVRSALGK